MSKRYLDDGSQLSLPHLYLYYCTYSTSTVPAHELQQAINVLKYPIHSGNQASSNIPLPPALPQYIGALNSDYSYVQRAEEAAQQTAEKAKETRPPNTAKSYKNRRQEFLDWCHAYCPPGPLNETPDDRKLHYFLVTQVVNREYKKKGKKRKQPSDESDESDENGESNDPAPGPSNEVDPPLPPDSDLLRPEEIPGEVLGDEQLTDELLERSASTPNIKRAGLSTVKMYIAVVVDLYNDQALADPHSNRPHPSGKLVEAGDYEFNSQILYFKLL
ncbi:hypothetical protein K501DRAFT_276482 [Backusella circina FSU 941]|nr:hypothetical protein K501DRAFT_276482 [Backusella circina FSU 941]